MPNYRNKNRNRNKNKQRNKQQQQQQQQQQQKQQPQKEKQEAEICKTKPEEASTASTALTSTPTTTNNKSSNPPTTPSNSLPPAAAHSPEVTNATAVCCSENNVKNIVDTSAANEKTSNELINVTENAAVSTISTNTNTSTTTTVSTTDNDNDNVKTVEETSIETNDTVLNEPSAIECDNRNKLNHAVNINDKMGNEKSKIIDHEKVESFEQSVQLPQQHQQLEETVNKPSSCVLGKVIVHRIVCEDSNSVLINKGEQNNSSPKPPLKDNKDQLPKVIKEETEAGNTENVTKVIEHKLITSKESENQQDFHHERVTSKQLKDIIESGTTEIAENNSQKENLAKVIIHQVQITPESKEYNNEVVKLQISEEKAQKVTECPPNETQQQTQAKVIVHKVELQHEDSPPNIVQQHEVKVIVHKVQTPEEEEEEEEETPAIANPTVSQHQAKVIVHQIHLEEKDEEPKICSPTLKEPIKGKPKPSTSDVRIVEISDESLSDLEELKSPVVSEAESSTECADEIQKVAESITEVSSSTCSSSSSSSSSSTTSSQKQSRKQKRIALEHHFLPQMLNPRFLDSISEENSELSDNSENPLSRSASNESATNCPSEGKAQKLNAKYPKSSLDFSKTHKQQTSSSHSRKTKVIREEPLAVAVSARLQDAPDADESCTTVRSCMSPEAEAAEVVFINSASSSMSDLHDMELFENVQNSSTQDSDLDTDLSGIVNTRVTDNICSTDSLTSSSSSPSPSPIKSAFTAKIPQKLLPEFCANNKNNQTINNSKFVNNNNNNSTKTLNTTPSTFTTNTINTTNTTTNKAIRSLAADEIKTKTIQKTNINLKTDSDIDSLLSISSSPALDEQLVFAQIEEQISSVLSSINEVASQNNNTTTKTTKETIKTSKSSTTKTSSASSSSLLLSSLSSSSSSLLSTKNNIHTNLSNTQKLPVTTTSTTSASRTLETSCEESFNTGSNSSLCAGNNAKTSRDIEQNVNMNTVRDLIINNNNNANANDIDNTVHVNGNENDNEISATNGYVKLNYNNNNTFTPIPPPRGSPPPPPIPPPPSLQEHEQEQTSSHDECDNSAFNSSNSCSSISSSASALPLLQKHVDLHNSHTQSQHELLKSYSNSALKLLTSSITRQESMDSHCSDSTNISQCTAINVAPEQTSDSVQTSSISDLQKTNATPQSAQPTDVINSSVGVSAAADPKKLRLLCAETLASFPYGDAVLEELATVAQNIGEARAVKAVKSDNNMPYPLPELPHIDDLQLSLKVGKDKDAPERPAPPQQGDSWLGVQTNNDPKVLVCLSPSQRSYIQQKPEQKPDDLLDAHQKFVERRGYHEYTKEQLQNMEREKLAEQQLLQTAAMMKKLRKSITPPPPQIPPPPVPVKSSETASKAQNLSKRTVTTTTTTNSTLTHTQKPNGDANLANDKEQISANTKTNGENNGEENKHRLLSIIQDTSTDSNANRQQPHSVPHFSSSSSFENNSRQTTNTHSAPVKEQVQSTNSTTLSNGTSNTSYQFPQLYENKGSGNMQSVETTLGQMFPNMGSSNIFDQEHKRFSNIESSISEPFCSQILNTQPKRYSSIETHSYETQKRIENGKVVQDFSTSKHETKTSGDKPDEINSFPLKTSLSQETNSFLRSGNEHDISKTTTTTNNNNNTDDQEIMSALNLNNHSSDRKQQEHQQQTATKSETIIKTTTTETSQNNAANDENKNTKNTDENDQNRIETKQATETNNAKLKSGIQDTYEEFRQRAKAAADAASTLPTLNLADTTATVAPSTTEKVTSNGDNSGETISSTTTTTTTTTTEQRKATLSHDHEKLFKEFDELSKQLHRELETSKAEREQREKSASMFDLNRVHMRQKQQIEEFNKTRHEHLKELEKEIDRSMRSRSLRFNRPPPPPPSASSDTVDHQSGRVYQIPIQIENGNTTIHPPPPPPTSQVDDSKPGNNYEEAPPVPEPPRTYQIPIQIENSHNSYVDDGRFRRAESMFNLSDDMHRRQRTYSTQSQYQRAEDDWSKYASDLGSSENIARPFAKEVEICYQRRPGGIRAPRLTASTNDLSFNNQHSYDQYNAYNVRRHHAPMLNRAPEQSRPQFGSCYSMIERDPNPKYISTTTRRGVSPAPQSSGYFPLESVHVREEDMRQRRASLPREIHEQQLKYIASKEEELRTEFQRLQAERRRLMEEAQRAQTMQQVPQTPPSPQTPTSPMTRTIREHYRSTQKLPTLTEDEVFRQQMAEEWLSKVAEREKRRLQNIIKISKITEDQEAATKHKANMEEEFLSRVKERRHKLAMPADSDWESGAESQPTHQAQLSETEDVPPVKIIEGEQEANLRRLPRHLREFAKFSNHQKENIEGGHREEHQEEERSEETTDNSVSRAVKKSSVIKTVKTLRAPMLPENGGHENDNYDEYKNDNDNYDVDVNNSDQHHHHHYPYDGFDVSSSDHIENNFEPFSNISTTSFPTTSEFLTQFPGSFDEMFGKSPFRSRILQEFNNYWRDFHNAGNNF